MTNKTGQQEESSLGRWLFVIISALLCLGALMVFSAGASLDRQIDVRHFWRYTTLRRVAFVPIVWVVLAVVGRCNYRKVLVFDKWFWLSPIVIAQILAIAALAAVLVPGIGTQAGESRRWLVFGGSEYGLQFQPSELAKWVTVMFLAAYGAYKGESMRKFVTGFLPACVVLMLVAGLIGKEDFGTAALVGAMGIVVLIVAGVRWWHPLSLVPPAVGAFYQLVYCVDYRWVRVTAFWHGGQESQETLYHAQQSIMAIGTGGLWGCGLGQGKVKLGWLPEDTTDFIFAVIGEELGFVGCGIVIALFVMMIICGIMIVKNTPDRLGKLLTIAITGTIGAQALMNLLVVSDMAPTKGIALPFVSAGGSGLVMTAVAVGVVINIARQKMSPLINTN